MSAILIEYERELKECSRNTNGIETEQVIKELRK
jgi:hypothetical protein